MIGPGEEGANALKRYLQSPTPPSKCQDLNLPGMKIFTDYDVSTDNELISTLILMVIFIIVMAYQLLLVKHTYACMKKSKIQIKYLFIVQTSSFGTLFFYFLSKILMICFYLEVRSNPEKYYENDLLNSGLNTYISIYDITQVISIIFYLLTFYLAIDKWFGILRITTGDSQSTYYAQIFMNVIFGLSFVAMIGSIICLALQVLPEFLQQDFDHWSNFGSILVTGLSTSFFTWRLSKKIELIYEIDYEFKRKLKFQFWLLIGASLFRSFFNLAIILLSFGDNNIKCFGYENGNGLFYNQNDLWACILPLVVIACNCAVIPFSMLFSPAKKFRIQKEIGPLSCNIPLHKF